MKPFVPFDQFERGCLPDTKSLHESMQENCNARLAPKPEVCKETCIPYWQRTEEIECGADGLILVQEANGCGDTRMARTSNRVTWTNTDETECDEPRNLIRRQQINQCGETRWVTTSTLCCTPEWIATGDQFCGDTLMEVAEEDGCGNTRRRVTPTPVFWVSTGEVRCEPGNIYMAEQQNSCGDTRWTVLPGGCPCMPDWQPLGPERCTGEFIEQQQVDGCGHTRWHPTTTFVIWNNTGETRCNGGFIQQEQISQCGTKRWLTTETVCVNSPAPVESDEVDIDTCLSDSGVSTMREFNVILNAANGTFFVQGQSEPDPISFAWVVGAYSRNDYEARWSWTGVQPVDGTNRLLGGSTPDTWYDLAETSQVVCNFRAQQDGNQGLSWDQVLIRFDIRRKGVVGIEGGATFGPLFFRLNMQCP